jgi:hypothetical protein
VRVHQAVDAGEGSADLLGLATQDAVVLAVHPRHEWLVRAGEHVQSLVVGRVVAAVVERTDLPDPLRRVRHDVGVEAGVAIAIARMRSTVAP